VRPRLDTLFSAEWPRDVEMRGWQGALADSERHVKAASNKIRAA
jgi:hypothetical protein